MLQFVVELIDQLYVSDLVRIAVVKFSDDVDSVFHLNNQLSDISEMESRIKNISYVGGNTDTAKGIEYMRTVAFTAGNGDRPDVQNIAIIITDGESTTNKGMTVPNAIAAQNDGIKMYSVGITNLVNEDELRNISSPPHQKDTDYFMAPSFQVLGTVTEALTAAACGTEDNGKCAVVCRLCYSNAANVSTSFQIISRMLLL